MRCEPRMLLAGALLGLAATAAGEEPGPERREAIAHLLRHDCGSCHGLTLRGGLGPPLTADALRGRDLAALEAAIAHGRPGTPMPPWQGMLAPHEVRWLVRALLAGSLE